MVRGRFVVSYYNCSKSINTIEPWIHLTADTSSISYLSHTCIPTSLRFIRRLTPYNVSVRTWASCAVELTSGLELITSFRLLRFYCSSNFYVSYIIKKLGICSFQRYATIKYLSSRKGAVTS